MSISNNEKKSVMHLKAIERQRELIGKLTHEGFLRYLPLLQEALKEDHAIEVPPKLFVPKINTMHTQPAVRKEPPPFEFSSSKASLDHN